MRNLVIVLGDQLDANSSAFDGFDASRDCVWMAEVAEESTHVWSAKQRIALFLSAMRHFAEELRALGRPLRYRLLDEAGNTGALDSELSAIAKELRPASLVMCAPGDWRVLAAIRSVAKQSGIPLDIRQDRHFFSTIAEFSAWRTSRTQMRQEYWYRDMRRKHNILMQADGRSPLGGRWNFDAENRKPFSAKGPPGAERPLRVAPDDITRDVIRLVNQRFADHPGSLDSFDWAVTSDDAAKVLDDFVTYRLPLFGSYEDAMWLGEPWLFHGQLSSSLNLKLLDPRVAIDAALKEYAEGSVPLSTMEGFARQILGWREYVRGLYWTEMPEFLSDNALDAHAALPGFYWDGNTDMACLREVIVQTLALGYAHHIQRLMVTGLYAMLFGVDPKEVHQWYLSVYVDAVEWVELPNTIGMSQFGDGGRMTSKPYAASGKYIQRMSNYCTGCRYDPAQSTGPNACPVTTLYWDFLMRNEPALSKIPRMKMQINHLVRMDAPARQAIRVQAEQHRQDVNATLKS